MNRSLTCIGVIAWTVLAAVLAVAAPENDKLDLFPKEGQSELLPLTKIGVAVEHFKVPYGRVVRGVDFYVAAGNAKSTLAGHSLVLRLFGPETNPVAQKTITCDELAAAGARVSISGLNLTDGWYRIELFSNSDALRAQIRIPYYPGQDRRDAYAAEGWKGGRKIGGTFRVRLDLAAAAGDASVLGGDPAYLIRGGKANYRIVLPDDADLPEETAAKTLRDTLKEITGVELPVISAAAYRSGPMIAVGFNAKLPPELSRAAFGEMPEQTLVIKSRPGILLLAGEGKAGALYAVYEYLYDLGVRWYSPKFTRLPKLADIPFPTEEKRYSPPLLVRGVQVGNAGTNEWRSRNHQTLVNNWESLGAQYGFAGSSGPDMHTFHRLVPGSVLKEHPDWLCEINGVREQPTGSYWGLCLSNPEVRRYLVKRTVDYALKNPSLNTIWVGQNDGSQYCRCEKCRAFYAAHGGAPSSLMVQLINEISDAMEAAHPGRTIKTLAYGWTVDAPENMTLRDNVMVMFCFGGDFFRPIATDPERAGQRAAFEAWRKVAKHFDAYLYFPFDDYLSPAPCTYAGAENIKWCAKNGFDATSTVKLSGHNGSYGSESMDLRAWVYSRLLWNPALDTQSLIDEFITDYYGPAAEPVRKVFELTHRNLYDGRGALIRHENNAQVPYYVNPEVVREANGIFEKAYASLPDGVYKEHLAAAWIPYLWADFWLGFGEWGRYDPAAGTWSVPMADGKRRNRYARWIKQFMSAQGMNATKELRKFNPALLCIDKIGVDFPAVPLRDGKVSAVVIPEVGGKVFDFRDDRFDFAPLKEFTSKIPMEYPLVSGTGETVGGGDIREYRELKRSADSVLLGYEGRDYTVCKEISLTAETLKSEFVLTARGKQAVPFHNTIMFDLYPGAFGFYPTMYVEKRDGSWNKVVMGAQGHFHWIDGSIDLSNATGKIVLQRQDRPEGVLLTVIPGQVGRIAFWYSRDTQETPEDKGWGMLRLFLYPEEEAGKADQSRTLTWSLRILPDVASAVGK